MPKRVRHISGYKSIKPIDPGLLVELLAHRQFGPSGHSQALEKPDGMSDEEHNYLARYYNKPELVGTLRASFDNWRQAGRQLRDRIEAVSQVSLYDFLSSRVYQVPALDGCWGNVFLWDRRNTGVLDRATDALVERTPLKWPFGDEVLFGHHFWSLSAAEQFYDDDQLRLVFLDTVDKERRKFEKLKLRHSGLGGAPIKSRREAIPEEVRMYVWRRDQGRCVKCGSAERLEFDHIIPFSKGGSATERNIQLLCESCNREKRDDI